MAFLPVGAGGIGTARITARGGPVVFGLGGCSLGYAVVLVKSEPRHRHRGRCLSLLVKPAHLLSRLRPSRQASHPSKAPSEHWKRRPINDLRLFPRQSRSLPPDPIPRRNLSGGYAESPFLIGKFGLPPRSLLFVFLPRYSSGSSPWGITWVHLRNGPAPTHSRSYTWRNAGTVV